MNEYITKEDARLNHPEWLETIDDFSAGFNVCIHEYIDRIDEIPAADIAPVVHGKWINPHWQSSMHCMNCNQCKYEAQHSVYHGVEKYYHYCPNCGAKMDGKDRQDG